MRGVTGTLPDGTLRAAHLPEGIKPTLLGGRRTSTACGFGVIRLPLISTQEQGPTWKSGRLQPGVPQVRLGLGFSLVARDTLELGGSLLGPARLIQSSISLHWLPG